MALGNKNVFVLSLGSAKTDGQAYDFVGGGAEADVAAAHKLLGYKARLEKVKVSIQAMASSKTAAIQVYAGSSKSGTAVLSSTVDLTSTSLTGSGTIIDVNKKYDEDQEFCLSENSTTGSNGLGLGVDLYFRMEEA
jgi:hypothetical protein